MLPTHPPLSNITNASLPTQTKSDPIHQTPHHKPRLSLDHTSSPATPESPESPHSAHFVTATSTPSSLPRFPETSALPAPSETPTPTQPQTPNPATPPKPHTLRPLDKLWTRPTRPVSPDLHLAAAAATRAAAHRNDKQHSLAAKPPKPRAVWPAGHTVPKSPKLCAVGKPLSKLAAQRKAQLYADDVKHKRDLERREELVKQRRRNFANCRTVPKSPAFKGKRKIAEPQPEAKRRFVPNKMPDFGRGPTVRGTTKSMAHALVNREGGNDRATRESYMMKKGSCMGNERRVSVRMERTVAKPFGLRGVDRHAAVTELRMMQMEREAEEENRRRTFRPVVLKEEILDGPTFVPRAKVGGVTEGKELLPGAMERRERTMAFQRRQQERMAAMEREEKRKQLEKEEKELEEVMRMLKETQFKPRGVPRSHYRPDIEPVGCGGSGLKMKGERLRGSGDMVEGGQVGEDESGSGDSWPVVRKSSLFEEFRKSFPPLKLWSPDGSAGGETE